MRTDARPLRGLLVDLDGTLADTAPDLAAALNAVLTEEDRDLLPFPAIRPWVSFGAPGLIRLGFGKGLDERDFERLRARLLSHYAAALCRETRLFDGFDTVLAEFEAPGRAWGVVTNKPAALTDPLMTALGLADRARSVVSGDTLPRRKPHPEPLLHAAGELGFPPAECVYVGDARRDIEAGRAAGMLTIAVAWGYIPEGDPHHRWEADAVADTPEALLALLRDRAAA